MQTPTVSEMYQPSENDTENKSHPLLISYHLTIIKE